MNEKFRFTDTRALGANAWLMDRVTANWYVKNKGPRSHDTKREFMAIAAMRINER